MKVSLNLHTPNEEQMPNPAHYSYDTDNAIDTQNN